MSGCSKYETIVRGGVKVGLLGLAENWLKHCNIPDGYATYEDFCKVKPQELYPIEVIVQDVGLMDCRTLLELTYLALFLSHATSRPGRRWHAS
jgi:hypothetical protein